MSFVSLPVVFDIVKMADTQKASVLIIGGGAVGAVAALNLERGGFAKVTLVLRSNYDAVNANGFDIKSCDHGHVRGWKPTIGVFCSFFSLLRSLPC